METIVPVIETRGLTKTYKGVQALQALDMEVTPNSICGFLGPNGAGKTTTIKLLLGLARPTGGGKVFDLDIVKENDEIRRRVGYLAQDPHFCEYMTGRQTLRFAASFFYEEPRAAIEQRVAETLDLVGLADKADRPVKGFSGGERQHLGIAQAQMNYPDLLILDEPAASLDPQGRHDILDVMERLRCKIDARTLPGHPYRAILTLRTSDQHTPGGQRRIKDRWPETRIVLTSMVATHRGEALAAGAEAFLVKGEPGETLATAILGKL